MTVPMAMIMPIFNVPWTGWNIYGIAQEAATAEGKSPSLISRNTPDSVSYTPTATLQKRLQCDEFLVKWNVIKNEAVKYSAALRKGNDNAALGLQDLKRCNLNKSHA